MKETIASFRGSYAERFRDGASGFFGIYGLNLIKRLQAAVRVPKCSIYIFGNGGCHAIGKCVEYALQAYASSQGLPLRVQTGIDVHQMVSINMDGSPGFNFVKVLRTEGADSKDLVLLLSGSGDSDNLCDVAHYAQMRSIPVLAIIGQREGKLKSCVLPENCFSLSLRDQQISEDIIQTMALLISQCDSGAEDSAWQAIVNRQATVIASALERVPAVLIEDVTASICGAFKDGKSVWVLGFDDPVLSVVAEHTAHNLYWDGIYQVATPPMRIVRSSPTACDFSGISNDRRLRILENITGIRDSREAGIALLYSMTVTSPALQQVVECFKELGVKVFVVSALNEPVIDDNYVVVHQTQLASPQAHASVSQMLGHVLGRVVRMKLLNSLSVEDNLRISNPASFLNDYDLAQRRLLDA